MPEMTIFSEALFKPYGGMTQWWVPVRTGIVSASSGCSTSADKGFAGLWMGEFALHTISLARYPKFAFASDQESADG